MKFNKNLNYKQRAFLGLTINIAIMIAISYFFVFSYFNRVINANAMLINHRVEFEIKLIKEEKFSKISKNLSEIENDVKRIENAFIDQNKKLEFITMFEGLADDNRVEMMMNINFDKMNPKDKSIPLNLSLTGNYDSLMNFLVSIENIKPYININQVNLRSSSSNTKKPTSLGNIPSNNNLTMTIVALSYWK